MSEIKNKQHYVFQAYLRRWCDDEEQVCVLKKTEKKLFRTSTTNILHQRRMYKIQELNKDEKEFFELLMTSLKLSNADKSEMRDHINAYLLPYSNQRIVDALKAVNPIPANHLLNNQIQKDIRKLNELISKQKINTEEDFYSDYEGDGKAWIDSLIKGDLSFYYVDDSTNTESGIILPAHYERDNFLNFLCIQYFRTAGMRKILTSNIVDMLKVIRDYRKSEVGKKYDNIEIKFNPENVNPEHILPHMIWIIQAKCAAGLGKADLQVVRNRTSLPFITSDQPVINMKAKVGQEAPTEFVLYYPLSPEVAIIVNGGKGEKELDRKTAVDELNQMIWEHSFDYIVTNNEDVLNGMLEMEW